MLGEAVLRSERLTCCREHERGIAKRRERDPVHAVGVGIRSEAGCLQREPRLPGAARAGEREQASVVCAQELDDLGQFLLSAEEGRRGHRQVRAVEGFERGEVAVSELVDALGSGEVLQPMLAEVAKFALDELRARRGHEHLTAVAAGGDARGAVDVVSHIALVGQKRRSGVQADPDLHLPGRKRIREGGGGGERSRRGREGEEEGVTLRIHLDPALRWRRPRG